MIKRKITNKVLSLSKKFPVVSITGPRQSGKTTLVKDIFKRFKYANLENSQERDFAKRDPESFLDQSDLLVVDEVQRVPELFSYIQIAVDENKNKRLVISGSQNFLLHEKVSQTLAGRVAVFKLLPFSLAELRKTSFWHKDFNDFIFKGFYPRIYDKKLDPNDWYANYIETYLERDVRSLVNVGDFDRFVAFIKSCAANSGSVVNYSTLANNAGISPNNAKAWLSILKQSYIVFTLPPYYKSIGKQLRKSAKLYFYDTGLLCHLLGIRSRSDLVNHYLYGSIFENFVIAEMIKKDFNQYSHLSFYYLRDKLGNEVDLIYKQKGVTNLVEIKSGRTFKSEFSKGIEFYRDLLNEKTRGFVLYTGRKKQSRKDFTLMNWLDMVIQ